MITNIKDFLKMDVFSIHQVAWIVAIGILFLLVAVGK
jgi:hypothetical protein